MDLGITGWQRAILYIDEMNTLRLSRKIDITYSHLTRIVRTFEKNGWITIRKKGRENVITLTKKGHEMQDNCRIMINMLKIRVAIR